jgi:hypothetical protein
LIKSFSEALFAISTIKTTFNLEFVLTIVDLDIANSIRCGHCVTHLCRIVVAPRKKILALHLLAVMAESVPRGSQLSVLLSQ